MKAYNIFRPDGSAVGRLTTARKASPDLLLFPSGFMLLGRDEVAELVRKLRAQRFTLTRIPLEA